MSGVWLFLLIGLLVIIIALSIKAIRKAAGLLLVILGVLSILTGPGMIIGIPMIFIGGILLFA